MSDAFGMQLQNRDASSFDCTEGTENMLKNELHMHMNGLRFANRCAKILSCFILYFLLLFERYSKDCKTRECGE